MKYKPTFESQLDFLLTTRIKLNLMIMISTKKISEIYDEQGSQVVFFSFSFSFCFLLEF